MMSTQEKIIPTRINLCVACGEHFAAVSILEKACEHCAEEWTPEEIMDREG